MRRQLVYLSPVEWHGLRQRPQEVAQFLSAEFQVTYVNPVATRNLLPRDFGRLRSFARGLSKGGLAGPAHAVGVVSLLHLPAVGIPGLDILNEALMRREIESKIAPAPGYVLCVAVPSHAARAFLRSTRPGSVVYDCMDHYSFFHQGRNAARMLEIENEVLGRADIVFTSSKSLQRSLGARHRNVVLAPNGANTGIFLQEIATPLSANPVPEMDDIAGPILGYCGTIGDWVDFELLERLALDLPHCTMVLIGPWTARGGRGLLRARNVRWLGQKPHSVIPAYCRRFDVGLIPFVLNELSEGVNPIKLYEYLALGLPVVSTAIPEAAQHQPFVHAARGRGQFLAAVRESLRSDASGPGRKARMRYASAFSWDKTGGIIQSALSTAAR